MKSRRPAPQIELPIQTRPENGVKRQAARPLRPSKPQEPCDIGLFGDDAHQLDLVDFARKT